MRKVITKSYSLPPHIVKWIDGLAAKAKKKYRSSSSVLTEIIETCIHKHYDTSFTALSPYFVPRPDLTEWLEERSKKEKCSVSKIVTSILLDAKKAAKK